MGNIVVRNLDDAVIERLKQQADAAGRSMEAQAREILRGATLGGTDFDTLAAQMRVLTADRRHTLSQDLVREDRDR